MFRYADRMNRSIECIIFDLFGVLVAFDDGRVYAKLAAHCDTPAEAERGMHDLVSRPALICGRLSLEALWSELVTQYGLKLSLHDFTAVWQAPYSWPMPGMLDLLTELRGRCRRVLLSNVDPFHWPTVFASLPELKRFDGLSLSFEQGRAKPDALAFMRAIELSGVAIERCFFVDDKQENIHAAARLGLRGHHFTDAAELRRALQTAGLPDSVL